MTTTLAPLEGCDRCHCGAKYWDGNVCHSCGEKWRPVVIGVTAAHYVGDPDADVRPLLLSLAMNDGTLRDEAKDEPNARTYFVTFTDEYAAQDFEDAVNNYHRLHAYEVVLP